MSDEKVHNLGGALPAEALALIEQEISDRLRGQLRDFRLLIREDGLVLLGNAQSYYVKQLVQTHVQELTRHPIAANDVLVVLTSAT